MGQGDNEGYVFQLWVRVIMRVVFQLWVRVIMLVMSFSCGSG